MSGRAEVISLVLAAGLCCMPLQGARARHGPRYGGGFNSAAPTEAPTATPTLTPAGTPRLQLVSARDHVEGAFTGHRAVYADQGKIYLASSLTAAGTLFVLARDRESDFPLMESVEIGPFRLSAVSGDAENVFVTAEDGVLRVFRKEQPLQLARAVPLSDFGLNDVVCLGERLYVATGQARLAVAGDRLYLSALNEGDVALQIDTRTFEPDLTYGSSFEPQTTVVFDRATGGRVAGIINPDNIWGQLTQVSLYVDNGLLFQTQPGCCGRGIFIYDATTLEPRQWVRRLFTNTVRRRDRWLIAGNEGGQVEVFDLGQTPPPLVVSANLRQLTGHVGGEDIEIRGLWTDDEDELVFAASSWGNDESRSPLLPSFFVLGLSFESGPTQTPTATPTPTPTAVPCVGDCNEDGWVTIDELLSAVNIALGADMSQCLPADRDGNGSVTIDELLAAVRVALEGCRRSVTFRFDFAQGPQGWESLFTNYDVGDEQRLELVADYRPLPEPLDPEQEALFISGKNLPDDLNMFFKRRVEGLDPQLNYSVAFEVGIATNAPSGCAGVGGAPGEAVTVHTVASDHEPDRVIDEHAPPPYYRLNLAVDYGDTWYADTQLGHIGNSSHDCDSRNWRYELKRLWSPAGYWQVRPDAQGRAWLLVGTRSGFESTTSLYYTDVRVTFDPL